MLPVDDHPISEEVMDDGYLAVNDYEGLNGQLGGDSVRNCNGYACIGWVEDHYADGTLKHRGYYDGGQLLLYKNYHPDGTMEREFKVLDNTKCLLRTYHVNGVIRSETKYWSGVPLSYTDHYMNGQLRYEELKHKSEPYYLKMDLYAPDGTPMSTLELVDKKKVQFLQREYHTNGAVKLEGRSQYDPDRYDSRRIGKWLHFNESGVAVQEDLYVDGKVHESRTL